MFACAVQLQSHYTHNQFSGLDHNDHDCLGLGLGLGSGLDHNDHDCLPNATGGGSGL